jgi:predicted metal-dependent enzyme (double-stranded beta helix superfamily)
MGVGPHDHDTWAIVAGVVGNERNVRYQRLYDRKDDGHAELEIKDEMIAGPGDLVCMKAGGIHSVHNDNDEATLSLHTYGRHINHTIRSQFDMETRVAKRFQVDMN